MLAFLGSYRTAEGKSLPVDFSSLSADFWRENTRLLERLYRRINTNPLSAEIGRISESLCDFWGKHLFRNTPYHNDSYLFNPSYFLNQDIADAHFYQKGAQRFPTMLTRTMIHEDGNVHLRYHCSPLMFWPTLEPPLSFPSGHKYEEWKKSFSDAWNESSDEPCELSDLPYYTIPSIRHIFDWDRRIRHVHNGFKEFATWKVAYLPSGVYEVRVVV